MSPFNSFHLLSFLLSPNAIVAFLSCQSVSIVRNPIVLYLGSPRPIRSNTIGSKTTTRTTSTNLYVSTDYIQSIFPGALSNDVLTSSVYKSLHDRAGFTSENTLLVTSLCSDELAQKLADDFVKLYGNNFNLGGLAGFPFAGNIGFQTMAGHIPDDGFCFLLFGPHIGISSIDGSVGRVERDGVSGTDDCCRSAIEAWKFLTSTNSDETSSSSYLTNNPIEAFTDIQQNAVKTMMEPIVCNRLTNSEYPMIELPYALYESQCQFINELVASGIGENKRGLAILGGIQINTGPGIPDHFLSARFDLLNNRGEIVDDLLPTLLYMTS